MYMYIIQGTKASDGENQTAKGGFYTTDLFPTVPAVASMAGSHMIRGG